jgi:phosphoglycolate phosphatase-like HAD superfamily hydrolase
MKGTDAPIVLLWDIDGTLLRVPKGAVTAWRAAVRAVLGCEPDWPALDTAGATDVSIARQICALVGREAGWAEPLLARYLEELPGRLAEHPPVALPNVAAVLAYVAAAPGYENLLLTGNLRGAAWAKLSACGLGAFRWEGAFGDIGPERNQVATAAQQRVADTWGEATRMLVIGDTPRDIAAARFIGAKVAAVATGSYTAERLADYAPDGLFEALPEPPAFVAAVERLVSRKGDRFIF